MNDDRIKPLRPPHKANILVVDDIQANLQLLVEVLTKGGYKVRPALNGHIALLAAQMLPPDLILLDIRMPEMDGYEVCRQLKADKHTRDIPVIFISAIDDVLDKATAFSIGGVDYITKPFHPEEVLARVKTHLTIRNLQKRLEEQIAELDAFAHTVAHDLKSPLAIIIGYASILKEEHTTVSPEELSLYVQNLERVTQQAVNIVDTLLFLAGIRQKDVMPQPLDMAGIVAQALQLLEPMIRECQGEITLPRTWLTAKGYEPWIEEVWANYLSNGLKYGGKPPRLELGNTRQEDDFIRFWIRDNGAGLAPEAQDKLFTEFTRLSNAKVEGHGLGLSIVRRIVEKLGGQVGVESEVGQGSVFYFTLPGIEEETLEQQ